MACQRIERTRQCQSLSEDANAHLDAIESLTTEKPQSAKAFGVIAKEYSKLSKLLENFKSDSKRLDSYLDGYAKVYQEAAEGAQLISRGMKQEDKQVVKRGKTKLAAATKKEDSYIRKIEQYCIEH